MTILLIVFVICLVLMGASVYNGDDTGFVVAFGGAMLFGMILLVGVIMWMSGVPGIAW